MVLLAHNRVAIAIKTLIAVLLVFSVVMRTSADTKVIANDSVTITLDDDTLALLLKGQKAYWPNGEAVKIALPVNNKVVSYRIQEITNLNANRFKYQWRRLSYSGRGKPPKTFTEMSKLIDYVSNTPGAIAIIPSDDPSDQAKGTQ